MGRCGVRPSHSQVANSHVRANAVCLMMDAFPLHDPSSTREEIDTLLQKQFDLMSVSPLILLYYA